MIKSEEEVERFLKEFFPKLDIFGIFFLNRAKNEEALRVLGITRKAREEVVRWIEKKDYVQTIIDAISFGDMWVFGKDFDGTELYIKISRGRPNSNTICISFHFAEHPLNYPYKK